MKSFARILSVTSIFFLTVFLCLPGCKNGNKSNQNDTPTVSDAIIKEVILSPESQKLLYEFPTPFEVTQMLLEAQAGYILSITNSPDNVSKYVTEKSKALNLGIYSADLSYSATFNHSDEANKFLETTGKLADELGIAGVYDKTLLEKTKKFNNNKDSLVSLIKKAFGQTNDFLSKNNRNQITVLITTGGFTEGVYIAALLSECTEENAKIISVIASQKKNYEELVSILELYKDDPEMKAIYDEVVKLQPIWEKYNLGSGARDPQKIAKEISVIAENARKVFVQ